MRLLPVLVTLGMVCAGFCGAQDGVVPLGPGATSLGDIGIYSVAYQSYGKDVVDMPPAWSGFFEDVSGVAYLPGEGVIDRKGILLHSPWKVTPGRVWVTYPLQLPETKPITLSFGIAMRPDVCAPNRSDGVEFSCSVVTPVGGEARELMREHYRQGVWKDFSFDLSEWAGQRVDLILQTEPGPAKSPSWDYSYFGDAQIVCGDAVEADRDLVARLTSTKAYQAVAEVGLRNGSNDPSHGITPSNLLSFENRIAPDGDAFRFEYEGDDCVLAYTYEPKTGTLDDFTVQVDEGKAFQPALGGGATAVEASDGGDRPARMSGGAMVSAALNGDGTAVEVVWDYPIGDGTVRITWRFGIHGKALLIEAECDEPRLVSFSLGRTGQAPIRKTFSIPDLYNSASYLPRANLFTSRMLDWTRSHASACPQGEASYHEKTDGTRNPLSESGFVALSPTVQEVLPNIPYPASPYLKQLAPRIMLDIWGHHKGTYAGDAENLLRLKDNGVDNVAIISHVWQRYGYDVKLPDHLPANPQFGGDEGMVEFGRVANECGYVWSLHENYIDLYPDAPSYDPTARVLRENGEPSPAWFNQGTGVQSYGLKCNRALEYAKQNAPEVHRRFKTNAAYLDVHTCVPPWHQLDHEAGQPMAAMALSKVKHDSELFQYMRNVHEGPLLGEGHNHFYWAGLCDGAEAQVRGGENHVPLLDFDLLKLHPQMV
ncbi:MAG: hypothetical protein GY851_21835, partial [bacterium]|nr:hypothetical protein [bacterium]